MKTQKFFRWLVAGLTVLNGVKLSAHAQTAAFEGGVDVGNGGSGVRCGGATAPLSLYDFWQAENLPPYGQILRSQESVDSQMWVVMNRLEGVWPEYAAAFRREYSKLDQIRKDLPMDIALPETHDMGFSLRGRDCVRIQIALYFEREGQPSVLSIDPLEFSQLGPTEQAGLLTHEVLYKIDRFFGERTSEHAREMVGRLFSGAEVTRADLVPASAAGQPVVRLPGSRYLRTGVTDPFHFDRGTSEGVENFVLNGLPADFPPLERASLIGNWAEVGKFNGGFSRSTAEEHVLLEVQPGERGTLNVQIAMGPDSFLRGEGMPMTRGRFPISAGSAFSVGVYQDPEVSVSTSAAGQMTELRFSERSIFSVAIFGPYLFGDEKTEGVQFLRDLHASAEAGRPLVDHFVAGSRRQRVGFSLKCNILDRENTFLLCQVVLTDAELARRERDFHVGNFFPRNPILFQRFPGPTRR